MIALQTPYHIVETGPSASFVRMRRTSAPYPTLADMERDYEAVLATFDRIGRERKVLLIDLREGPRRNDPAFEDVIRRLRPKLFRGFRLAAVVVSTAVGALQVKRHMREDGMGAEVFHDEHAAIEWLRTQSLRAETIPVDRSPSTPPPEDGETGRSSWTPPLPFQPARTSWPPPDPGFRGSDPGDEPDSSF